LLDPTNAALAHHLEVTDNGEVHAKSAEGQDVIDQLHLNSDTAIKITQGVFRVLNLKQRFPHDDEVEARFRETFGYPKDLPDLRKKKPPTGNSREDGIESCFFVLRSRGVLSATY